MKRLDATRVELEFAIPADELERARERAFREVSRNVKLPGFRPGKIPRKLFEANYGTQAIEERARDRVLNDAYAQALKDNDLEPVERPSVEELPPPEGAAANGELRFRAEFAVRPHIALKQYKGLTVMSPPTAVSDAEVDESLETLRRSEAVLVPVDRPIQMGDVATVDYAGTIDGTPFEGGTATNQTMMIAEGRFIPGFIMGIIGMRTGESRDVTATFPSDYGKQDLAGKTAIFHVTVHDVKVPEPPELSDEFAARFLKGENATVDTLRSELRGRLERTSRARAQQAMSGEILERLRGDHDFPLPEVMVSREAAAIEEEARKDAERAGVAWDDFLQRSGKTEDELRGEMRHDAERRVKTGLLLEAIAKAENIRATDQDIQREVAGLSLQYGKSPQEILEQMRPNLPALIDGIVRTKTVEFLVNSAQRIEGVGPRQ